MQAKRLVSRWGSRKLNTRTAGIIASRPAASLADGEWFYARHRPHHATFHCTLEGSQPGLNLVALETKFVGGAVARAGGAAGALSWRFERRDARVDTCLVMTRLRRVWRLGCLRFRSPFVGYQTILRQDHAIFDTLRYIIGTIVTPIQAFHRNSRKGWAETV